MQQLDLVIHNATGLHARPARVFVDIAKQFTSSIYIQYGEKRVNAKSMISVLTLGVPRDQRIHIDITGEDETAAATALEAAVRAGLGDEPVETPVAASEPAAPRTVEPQLETPIGFGAIINGVAGAPGIAVGPIFRIERVRSNVRERFAGIDQEQARLQAALETARQQLITLGEQMRRRVVGAESAIFDVHRSILDDEALLDTVRSAIADGRSAAVAWQAVIADFAATMAGLSDPVLAERASDVRDVGERVLRLLTGAGESAPALPDHPVIVVAYELTPSETVGLDPARVLGFCTAVGGANAHTSILARALGLPAVVSAGPAVLELEPGARIILDGGRGTLTLEPDEQAVAAAYAAQQQERDKHAAAMRAAAEPAITVDGHRVEVGANIGGLKDAEKAAACGAEGVGLLRTEFLFLDRAEAPGEEAQFAIYRDIAQALGGQPVIVRTLDIGGDKPLPYLELPAEENPFLGERGIRLCLANPELLRVQLRAILRAASFGRLRVMFPMIADITELRAARRELETIRRKLGAPPIDIGIMVEVPSAALMADVLAHEIDFFSIGANDLTQYTLAMDRTHPVLATKADGLHPAVLRLIARTVEAAHAAGKWVGVCGELGADPLAVPILVGLGVDELSVSVPAIPTIKAQIRSLNRVDCRALAQRALACATAAEVREGARQQ
jgi:phosphocarrier protein FPr